MKKSLRQVGAVPFSWDPNGTLAVLLVTSRETGRWVIPKGWPMKSRSSSAAAAQEAFEEAGVRGRIKGDKLGRYHYLKRKRDDSLVPCVVHVFPLLVEHLAESWPEQDERRREWFAPADAAEHVDEPELREILLGLEESVAPPKPRAKGSRGRKAEKNGKKRRSRKSDAPAEQAEPLSDGHETRKGGGHER